MLYTQFVTQNSLLRLTSDFQNLMKRILTFRLNLVGTIVQEWKYFLRQRRRLQALYKKLKIHGISRPLMKKPGCVLKKFNQQRHFRGCVMTRLKTIAGRNMSVSEWNPEDLNEMQNQKLLPSETRT